MSVATSNGHRHDLALLLLIQMLQQLLLRLLQRHQ